MPKGIYDRSKSSWKPWNKERKLSENHKKHLSISHIGKKPWMGKRHTELSKQKMSLERIGKRPANFIKDRIATKNKWAIRHTPEWKNWRKSVFERDNYMCKECGKSGGYLEPHHIRPIREDFNQELLFALSNGITLCRPCHQKTIWKESNYISKYSNIVAAQV